MAKPSKTVQRAMDLAIKRVRFEQYSGSIEKEMIERLKKKLEARKVFGADFNIRDELRDMTKLYVDSCLVPLLINVRDGNTHALQRHLEVHNQ